MSSFDEQMGKLLEAATEIGAKVIGSAIENGPQAMDMILWTYRYDGIATIVQGIICVIFAAVTAKFSGWAWKTGDDRNNPALMVASVISGCVCFATSLAAIAKVFDKWAWAAVIDPKLYMAHVILSKIGG